jgi:predicted acetyltransferase
MNEPLTIAAPADVDELKAFLPVQLRTYRRTLEEGLEWAEAMPIEHFRILRRGDRPIGGMNLIPMGQWFGGRAVAMTGIGSVGIDPAERATGAGTAFMRMVLEELHGSGVAISTLYPATQTIYRRCGYELAGHFIRYRLASDHIDVRDRTLRVELTEDRDEIKRLYDERARRTNGALDRGAFIWERVYRAGKADAYLMIGPDGPEGYIFYTRRDGDDRDRMHAHVVALTRAAARRILTFIADHRSFVEAVEWTGAPADPFGFQLSEPRIDVHYSFPWMTRIVDVRAALTERGYADALDAELHLHVRDDVLPANDGRIVLRVSGGKAEVQPGGTGAMSIDVRGLASMYTGYASAYELSAAGYIDAAEADLLAANAIFAGPTPWLADFF